MPLDFGFVAQLGFKLQSDARIIALQRLLPYFEKTNIARTLCPISPVAGAREGSHIVMREFRVASRKSK
jgi:hypothetical protein